MGWETSGSQKADECLAVTCRPNSRTPGSPGPPGSHEVVATEALVWPSCSLGQGPSVLEAPQEE